ncbi:box A-binding factor-like [Calliphora vicina]|uniref:box A-binding factor-like n=1 Tax=Calliphora vicina TaxID=7373 RepID=UPI00325BAAFF
MPYNRHTQHPATTTASATLSGMQTLIPNSTAASNIARNEAGIIVHNSNNNSLLQQQQNATTTTSTNPHQMTYNLNNCFPKSYTEYYQQQQQLQHPHTQQQQQQQQHHHQFPQKFNNAGIATASSHLINAIEHDFNTYAVVERQQPPQIPNATLSTAAAAATNPFLAVSNFKKFDTSGDEDLQSGNYQTASMKRQGKRKTFADKLEDKRFYSLKFTSNNNKQKQQNKSSTAAAALNINHSFNGTSGGGSSGGVLGSLLSSTNKCKRHHSFAGGSLGDIDPKGPVRNPHMNFYDPPAYENVNDAVQVHNAAVSDMELPEGLNGSAQTATVLLHPLPYGIAGGSQGPKKKHHQRQHQPKEDLNLIEPERLSIYRSDSGISNSSYECVTPMPSNTQTPGSTPPPGKMPRTPKTPKTPKGHKNQTLAHTAVTAHFNSSHKKPAPRVPPTPLYMNVNDQQQQQQHASNNISNLERPSSPSSTMATSAYESASSSQNDNTCNDPLSLSSTTSLYSGGGNNKSSLNAVNQRCNRHQQPPEITTPEEFEQYQLGHHAHAHSSSSLSVASSVSASGSNAGGRVKCKKQQQQQQRLNGQGALTNHMEQQILPPPPPPPVIRHYIDDRLSATPTHISSTSTNVDDNLITPTSITAAATTLKPTIIAPNPRTRSRQQQQQMTPNHQQHVALINHNNNNKLAYNNPAKLNSLHHHYHTPQQLVQQQQQHHHHATNLPHIINNKC